MTLSWRPMFRTFDANIDDLLRRVDKIAPVLEATNAESEEGRTLAPAAVDALRQSGLFYLRVPKETGGMECSPVTQMAVLAEVAKLNPSAGWSLMVGNAANAAVATVFDSGTVDAIFKSSKSVVTAGISAPYGRAERAEGGYYVTGRWRFASGLPHADYVSCTTILDDATRQLVSVVLRRDQVQLADNWRAFGLRGTGSGDFIVERAWVPDAYARVGAKPDLAPLRGGALYRLPFATKITYEHTAIAMGMGQRALELLNNVIKTRVQGNGTALVDRDEVVYLLGKLALRLEAAGVHATMVHHQVFGHVQRNEPVPPSLIAVAMAGVCHVTQTALEVAQECFRLAATSALFEPSEIGRLLRDLTAANVHIRANDDTYYSLGHAILDPDSTIASYDLKPRSSRPSTKVIRGNLSVEKASKSIAGVPSPTLT